MSDDNWKKVIFAICGTVLILLYAILRFGGFCMYTKSIKVLGIITVIVGAVFFILMIVWFVVSDKKCESKYFCLSDDEKNKTFIVSKEDDCANKDQEIIIVKNGIALSKKNIVNPDVVKTVYFTDEINICSDLCKDLNNVELKVVNRDLICDYKKRIRNLEGTKKKLQNQKENLEKKNKKLLRENKTLKQKIEELKQAKKDTGNIN